MQKGAGMYISEENRKFTDSKRIAAVLTKELDDINELGSPQVRNSNAFVLKHNHAASAILELGYFSDEKDAKFISDPMNQRRIAEKIVSALIKY
jgi:N-acetylmuramoyl-L-alanine amidase